MGNLECLRIMQAESVMESGQAIALRLVSGGKYGPMKSQRQGPPSLSTQPCFHDLSDLFTVELELSSH